MAVDATEQDDVPVVFGAQEGQDRFDEVHVAEEDHFELAAHEIEGCGAGGEFFDSADDG